jgi:hypothetical protein
VRHEFEIYFWIRLSELAGNVDVKGLDKVFPESRKLWDGATKVTELGRIGQNLYHRGHGGLRGGSVVAPLPVSRERGETCGNRRLYPLRVRSYPNGVQAPKMHRSFGCGSLAKRAIHRPQDDKA